MRYRLAAIVPAYAMMFAVCYYAAFLLRFDFELPPEVRTMFAGTLAMLVGVKLLICLATGEWQRSYRYATLPDVLYVAASATASAAVLYFLNHHQVFGPIPRSIILIDWALSIPVNGLVRISTRVYTEMIRRQFTRGGGQKLRTLVFAPDREGIEILRTIQAADSEYQVVGLVDDGPKTWQRPRIAGVPVFSRHKGWKKLVDRLNASNVLLPGSTPGGYVREIVQQGREGDFKVHVIPSVHEIVGGRFKLSVRDVTISDLLRREPAELDIDGIKGYIAGKTVLVTGGAGSIGSELCRQIARLKPSRLVVFDQSEFGVFSFQQEVKGQIPSNVDVRFVIGDVTERRAVERVLDEHAPQVVFHAAAYKHVPLMEDNVHEAVRNNVLGTKTVVERAATAGVERFVLISTDKAVRPANVMGATKLVAEKCVQAAAARSEMRCITVRFGNVLNSAGSVVPTFRKQIERGGPITVTHPDIERFFMTIPEAVQLVLQAGAVGRSGDVLVLEMGEPCKIVDLARDMIALSGLRHPDDIDIEFTGLRPGEKMYEELFYDSETRREKVHDKIFCSARRAPTPAEVEADVAELTSSLEHSSAAAADALWQIVGRHVADDESPAQPLKSAA